jgi:hypothetical protein
MEEITAAKEIGGEKRSTTILVDLGENVEDAVAKFGAEVVFSNFKRAATITAQAAIRRFMDGGKTPEEISVLLKDWKPGVAITRSVDPVGALMGKFGALDAEEQSKILDALMEKFKGASA